MGTDYSVQQSRASKLAEQLVVHGTELSSKVAEMLRVQVLANTAIPSTDLQVAAQAVQHERDRQAAATSAAAPSSATSETADHSSGAYMWACDAPRAEVTNTDLASMKAQIDDAMQKLTDICSEPGCHRPATSVLTLNDLVGQMTGWSTSQKVYDLLADSGLPTRLAGDTHFGHLLSHHCDETARHALMAAQLGSGRDEISQISSESAKFARQLFKRIHSREKGDTMESDLRKLSAEYLRWTGATEADAKHADDIATFVGLLSVQ